MSVRQTARRQHQAIVDRAADAPVRSLEAPNEGWIATVRKALGMSAAQLARRLGVTRARVSHLEKTEMSGGVTLRTMDITAKAMGCRFVYAIVPVEGRVADGIAAQARRKAEALVARAGTHMALEQQSLPDSTNREEVSRIADDLARAMPSDFWTDE